MAEEEEETRLNKEEEPSKAHEEQVEATVQEEYGEEQEGEGAELDGFWIDGMEEYQRESSEYDSWFDLEEEEEEIKAKEEEEEEEEAVVEDEEMVKKEEVKEERDRRDSGKLTEQEEMKLLEEIYKEPLTYKLRPIDLPQIEVNEEEMEELKRQYLEKKEIIKPKIQQLQRDRKFKTNNRKFEFDRYRHLLESSFEDESNTSIAKLRHRITAGPTIIYFLQEKDAKGKYQMKPIRLPLDNLQSSRIFKEMLVYRRVENLTEEEKKELLAVNVAGKGVNLAEDDEEETYFQVLRKVPVIVVRGTVTVKKKDKQGNIIEEVHEAGFEYAEEDEQSLPNRGLYHNNYLEPPPVSQEREEDDTETDDIGSSESGTDADASSIGILWEKGIIVKTSYKNRLMNIKPHQKPQKNVGKLPREEKEKRVKLCSYLLIYTQLLVHLKKRSHDLIGIIEKYVKVDEQKDSPTARKQYKKLFIKNILHYRDIREKFLAAVTKNIEIIEKEYKRLEEAKQKHNDAFMKFMELEKLLLTIVDPVNRSAYGEVSKEKIEHLFRTKLLKLLMLKEEIVNYLKKLHTLAQLLTERRDLETAHQKMDLEKYHATLNKKRELEGLAEKSNSLLQELHETYLRAIKNTTLKFDEKDEFIERKEVQGLDVTSDFAERRRIKLLQTKQQRLEKSTFNKQPAVEKSTEKKQKSEPNRKRLLSVSNLMKY